ncbi:PEP-CTERM sorting domain-containing protein [Roseisolibacter agri]|uniref:PEP-CTERM protein-sorting domain-containing protein n=1 Tax=Roseisolibacter agri TaxID=2014610 RepID=A0AA37V187_9BACT|nr:PEP-CTERM sorting domain-containing protein [Roseisolibacter agri]GLC25795.1 hypothetical protein rosag_23080 [Roseisolibacter agri]
MKKQVAGLLPLLAAAAFQSADAQTILTTVGSACGGSQYFGCFDATLSLTGGDTFSLTITNTGAGAFTQIGIGGLSTSNNQNNPSFTYLDGTVSAPAGTSFGTDVVTNPNGLSGGTIDRPVIGIDAGGNNGLLAGGTATFSFMITSAASTFDLSTVQIAVHQQGGSPDQACGGSTKIVFSRNNANTTAGTMLDNTTNPLCNVPPGGGGTGSVVPEPATYALMGTGLLGLGLVGSIRSRRRQS